ncbi:MAG: DUF6036 family nucleotidyltransferase [Pirellulaceae bacterium]
MDLNTDFRDMLLALNDFDAKYLVVGAYAVAVHGHPRATGDLDIWVMTSGDNSSKVFMALKSFGAPIHEITESDFATPSIVFQIGVPPSRIDILTVISGVSFEDAWETRVIVTVDGIDIPVIGRTNLIRNKRATGRPKDLADIDAISQED